MRALLALVGKDLRLVWRSHVIYLALATALMGVAVGHLVRGKELTFAEGIYLVDRTSEPRLAPKLGEDMAGRGFTPVDWDPEAGLPEQSGKHHAFLPDETALDAALKDAEVGFGAVLTKNGDGLKVSYRMPDLLPEKTALLMARIWDDDLHRVSEGGVSPLDAIPVQTVGNATGAAPMGHTFVPLFLFTEAFIVGLWLGAVLLFVEKSGRTAHALSTTPAGIRGMLTAKTVALTLVVLLEVVITVVGVWGWHPGIWGALAASVILFLQAMGLTFLLAGWFQSLTGFTLVGVGLSTLASLPTISFFSSAFPDLWWHPTYAPFRVLRESFFPSGRPELVFVNLAIGAAVAALLMGLGAVSYRRRLVRA